MRNESATEILLKMVAKAALDKSHVIRRAASIAIQTIVESVTEASPELDTFIPCIVKNLRDPEPHVRHRYARLLGRVLLEATLKTSRPGRDTKKSKSVPGFGKVHYEIKNLKQAIGTLERFFAKTTNSLNRASLSVAMVELLQNSQIDAEVLPMYMTMIFNFASKGKPIMTEKDGRHTSMCLGFMLRHGLFASQREQGLEAAGKALLSIISEASKRTVSDNASNQYQLLICLEQLCMVFQRLGGVLESLELKDKALEALSQLLSDDNKVIRMHAAQCFRQLARAAPASLATWLSVLYKIVEISMTELASKTELDRALYCSLHGHVCALSAIVSVIADTPFGVPSSHLQDIFVNAQALVKLPCMNPRYAICCIFHLSCTSRVFRAASNVHGACVCIPIICCSCFCRDADGAPTSVDFGERYALKEAGWLLVTSLISMGKEWVQKYSSKLMLLWKESLTGKFSASSGVDYVQQELQLRMQALVALRAFVAVYRHQLKDTNQMNGQVNPYVRNTNVFISHAFKLIKDMDKEPNSHPEVCRAYTSFVAVLMDVYTALPPGSFSSQYRELLHFVVAVFTAPSAIQSQEIHRFLCPADDCLEEVSYRSAENIQFKHLINVKYIAFRITVLM